MILNFDLNRTAYRIELPNVSEKEYVEIESFFRPLINDASIKSRDAISRSFIFAMQICPQENPSDLWHHVLYRLYKRHKLGTNPEQSWVRTSGEAFEVALCEIYNPQLERLGLKIVSLISGDAKKEYLRRTGLRNIGSSKVDLSIEAQNRGVGIKNGYGVVGGIHAKVSLAERVSDDIPASKKMMTRGLISILITLDVKSFPPPHGDLVNRGEFGTIESPSDKRKYVENHGSFDVCFSYNSRTIPSNATTRSGKKIYTTRFSPDDAFIQFLNTRFDPH